MLIAIDTATQFASLALHDGHRLRGEYTWEAPRRHTVELLPRLASALEQVGLGAGNLSSVAVTRGPGSFTGLRVGLAVAKGLALARSLPLVGIPTLDVLAAAQGRDQRPLCTVLQAGRGRICVATYVWKKNQWRASEEPYLTTWESLARSIDTPTVFCGEIDLVGVEILATIRDVAQLLPAAARMRRAGFLADLAWQRLHAGETDDPAALTPIYLQHPAV